MRRLMKKSTDHQAFNPNWRVNIKRLIFLRLSFVFLFMSNAAEIPIMMYRTVHTGANNQSGGLNDGFCNLL